MRLKKFPFNFTSDNNRCLLLELRDFLKLNFCNPDILLFDTWPCFFTEQLNRMENPSKKVYTPMSFKFRKVSQFLVIWNTIKFNLLEKMFITGNIFHFTQIEETFCLTLSQMCPKKVRIFVSKNIEIFMYFPTFFGHFKHLRRHWGKWELHKS